MSENVPNSPASSARTSPTRNDTEVIRKDLGETGNATGETGSLHTNAHADPDTIAKLFRQVEQAKQEWEQTFDAIGDGISIHDRHYRVLRTNKAFARLFGLSPQELVHKICHEAVPSIHHPCRDCPLERTFMTGQVATAEIREAGLGNRYLEVSTYPLRDADGKIVAVVHITKDITQQKFVQDQLIRSEKLRALGEMASGVAHDLNNLLAAIIGRTELLLLERLDDKTREAVQSIYEAALDGAQIVRRIQEYSRIRRDVDLGLLDLAEIAEGAIALTRPRWKDEPERAGRTITVTSEFSPAPPVLGNGAELREVLVNLILNAVDAIPGDGWIRVRVGQQDDRVFVEVADSGMGMTPEVMRQIFNPFFTTKGPSGTGLGLSVAYEIISRHRGQIAVESAPEKGSKFTIFLPAANRARDRTRTTTKAAVPPPMRVLVLEDDSVLGGLLKALLERDGHKVSVFTSGKEGLAAFASEKYDVVLTDLGMPEMNGWEIARAIKEHSPSTPVILLTGWRVELDDKRLRDRGIEMALTKPYRLSDLRAALWRAVKGYQGSVEGPKARGEVRRKASSSESGGPGTMNILIVEDERTFGEALSSRLQMDGHCTRVARTGQEALACLQGEAFDLVLIDRSLPDISGLAVAETVRQVNPHAFITLITGFASKVDDASLLNQHIDAVLPKPWRPDEWDDMMAKAQKILGARRQAVTMHNQQ